MREMRHEKWLVVVLLAFVLSASATPSPAASAARDFGDGAQAFLMSPRSPAVTATAIAAPQGPAGRRGVAGSRPIHPTAAVSQGGAAHPTAVTLPPTPVPGPPALRRIANGQLPPEIMLDSHLLRAEEAIRQRDPAGARAAMEQIQALQDEHGLEIPAESHYRYATVWNGVGAWDQSLASAIRYLELTARGGDHYRDALTLMNRATAEIANIERERELRAAAEARARADEARARAERARALNAAREVVAQMEFVAVAAGEFRMGSGNRRGFAHSTPRTDVRITRPFEMGRYEVTQSEWEMVMGSNPSYFSECGGRCPVENVNWEDLQRYISILNSAAAGAWTYRLPTEAEWEYAARAGARGERWVRDLDLDAVAWHRDNSAIRTHPVGLKRPNRLGLYDMIGNVEEIVQDWYGPYPGGTVVDPTGPPFPRPRSEVPRQEKVTRGCNILDVANFCDAPILRQTYMIAWDDPRRSGREHQGFRLVRAADAAVNR